MKNTALLMNMIDRYNALAYTHNYIFGFEYHGNIYMSYADSEILPFILTLDKASGGQGMQLRFYATKDVKDVLMTSAILLCSKEYFNDCFENSKYNRGEVFEKLVTESFGQEWHKDNVPFTEDGDITVNGTAYQVKYAKASFTNEKILAKLEKRA